MHCEWRTHGEATGTALWQRIRLVLACSSLIIPALIGCTNMSGPGPNCPKTVLLPDSLNHDHTRSFNNMRFYAPYLTAPYRDSISFIFDILGLGGTTIVLQVAFHEKGSGLLVWSARYYGGSGRDEQRFSFGKLTGVAHGKEYDVVGSILTINDSLRYTENHCITMDTSLLSLNRKTLKVRSAETGLAWSTRTYMIQGYLMPVYIVRDENWTLTTASCRILPQTPDSCAAWVLTYLVSSVDSLFSDSSRIYDWNAVRVPDSARSLDSVMQYDQTRSIGPVPLELTVDSVDLVTVTDGGSVRLAWVEVKPNVLGMDTSLWVDSIGCVYEKSFSGRGGGYVRQTYTTQYHGRRLDGLELFTQAREQLLP